MMAIQIKRSRHLFSLNVFQEKDGQSLAKLYFSVTIVQRKGEVVFKIRPRVSARFIHDEVLQLLVIWPPQCNSYLPDFNSLYPRDDYVFLCMSSCYSCLMNYCCLYIWKKPLQGSGITGCYLEITQPTIQSIVRLHRRRYLGQSRTDISSINKHHEFCYLGTFLNIPFPQEDQVIIR